VAQELGWEIVAVDPAAGRVEATATTLWFGFKDDIVVRVRRADGGAQVDVRSVSRLGGGDLGANAARVRAFLERLETAAGPSRSVAAGHEDPRQPTQSKGPARSQPRPGGHPPACRPVLSVPFHSAPKQGRIGAQS
jgi:hypothetical protein